MLIFLIKKCVFDIHAFFISNTKDKLAKKQAKAKQHLEAEF